MFRIFVSGKLTDGTDAESGFPQCAAGLTQLQLFYNSEKGTSCAFLDKSAEVRGAVSEMCSCVVECGCAVILAEIIQDLRNGAALSCAGENGFDIILMVAKKLGPEHHQLGVEKGGAVSFVKHIFEIKIFQGGTDAGIITGMKDQKIPFCFLIKNMGKKLRKSTVRSKRLKESALEGGDSYDNVERKAVVKNSQAVLCVGRNDADISGLQGVMYALDLVGCSSLVNTENLKKIMLVGKLRSVAVMLADDNIFRNIFEHIVLTHVWEPWFLTKLWNEQTPGADVVLIQILEILRKSFGMFFFQEIYFFIKKFILGVFREIPVKI